MFRYFTFIICLLLPSIVLAASIETSAKQVIITDFETGQVLFEKNADDKMPTSSMSKVITAYAIMQEIQDGDLSFDDTFLVSEKAWKKGGSKMFVEVNKKIKVGDLLKGVIVQSGNDATIVLAEGLAGTEEKFAEHLNSIASKLGMKNSNFTNASGWPDDNHYSTARDLATLAYHSIKDFPEYYKLYGETEFTYNNIKQPNRNPLLGVGLGVDGIKTGHTDAAGYGLMTSSVDPKSKRRVIVVFNGTDSSKARKAEGEKLIKWGLNGFKNQKFIDKDKDIYKVPVLFGEADTVTAAAQKSLVITVEKLGEPNVTSKFQPVLNLEAPVKNGDIVGSITISMDGKPYKSINVVANNSVSELGAFKGFVAKTKHKFKNRK